MALKLHCPLGEVLSGCFSQGSWLSPFSVLCQKGKYQLQGCTLDLNLQEFFPFRTELGKRHTGVEENLHFTQIGTRNHELGFHTPPCLGHSSLA